MRVLYESARIGTTAARTLCALANSERSHGANESKAVRMYKLKVSRDVTAGGDAIQPLPVSEEIDSEKYHSTLSYMSARVRNINAWLAENHSEDLATNAYVHEGAVERAWWHAGYQCGIADMIRRLTGKGPDEYESNE